MFFFLTPCTSVDRVKDFLRQDVDKTHCDFITEKPSNDTFPPSFAQRAGHAHWRPANIDFIPNCLSLRVYARVKAFGPSLFTGAPGRAFKFGSLLPAGFFTPAHLSGRTLVDAPLSMNAFSFFVFVPALKMKETSLSCLSSSMPPKSAQSACVHGHQPHLIIIPELLEPKRFFCQICFGALLLSLHLSAQV